MSKQQQNKHDAVCAEKPGTNQTRLFGSALAGLLISAKDGDARAQNDLGKVCLHSSVSLFHFSRLQIYTFAW